MTGVALGAFGAHGLKGQITPDRLAIFQTGVQYQLLHALAIVAVAASSASPGRPWRSRAAGLWLVGIGLFSGSLYVLALSGTSWMGAVAPVGGLAFMIGWLALAIDALERPVK